MELYDEKLEEKKSKIPMIIGICIVILVVITGLIVAGIIYLKNSITIIEVDTKRNNEIEHILYIEKTEDGTEQLYLPILQICEHLGYEGFYGDYKDKSEDKTKCHVKELNGNEIAMFTKDSDTLIKINKNSEIEYITLDKPVFEKNGQLYTTIEGIQEGFNVSLTSDNNFKNIKIYTMDFLVQHNAQRLNIQKYATEFSDKKAIFENMLIVEENRQYGVLDVSKNKYVFETKYEEIKFLPSTSCFLVKSNGKYGIMNKQAEVKVKTVYDQIETIDNEKGLYLIKQNNSYGVINQDGEVIISPDYKEIGIDISKYNQNGVDNEYILLNEIIPIKNNENLWAFFNIKGEQITEFKYTGIGCDLTYATNSYPALVIPSHKIIIVKKDKFYNLITTEGEELISENIVDSVYFKIDITTEQNKFFMTSNNFTKVMNIEEWLTSIGR